MQSKDVKKGETYIETEKMIPVIIQVENIFSMEGKPHIDLTLYTLKRTRFGVVEGLIYSFDDWDTDQTTGSSVKLEQLREDQRRQVFRILLKYTEVDWD